MKKVSSLVTTSEGKGASRKASNDRHNYQAGLSRIQTQDFLTKSDATAQKWEIHFNLTLQASFQDPNASVGWGQRQDVERKTNATACFV